VRLLRSFRGAGAVGAIAAVAVVLFAPASASGSPDGLSPDVFVGVASGFTGGVSPFTDSVASGTSFANTSFLENGFNMWNYSSDALNASISVASGYDPSVLSATSLPIVQSQPSLPTGGGHLGLQVEGFDPTTTAVAGCDTSRSLLPLMVPVGGGQQTFTVTFRCTDPVITNVGAQFYVGVPGATVVSFTPPSNLDQEEQLSAPGPLPTSAGAFGLDIGQIVTGKTYTASFVLQVPNPFGIPFANKPEIDSGENPNVPNAGCLACGPQSTITVPVPNLDGSTPGAGSVTFSAGEPHVWSVNVTDEEVIVLGGTTQLDLSYQGPSSGTDGQPVMLRAAASWEDAGGQAGTPVTFTIGSQSCTTVTATVQTGGGDAVCMITLAQPVGSYTVLVTSPGDDSAYPASTSAPFSIAPPTPSSLCTLTRSYVDGSSKYQALKPAAQRVTDALVTVACQILTNIGPRLKPADKTKFVRSYQQAVQALVPAGWLTQTQAGTLGLLAGQL